MALEGETVDKRFLGMKESLLEVLTIKKIYS
jgi:hypothetical protein